MTGALGLLLVLEPIPMSAGNPAGSTGGALPAEAGQSHLVQDASWVALKLSGRIHRTSNGLVVVAPASATPAAFPSSSYLSTSTTAQVIEPEGDLYDDAHQAEADLNYWNFCAAGAGANAVYYFRPTNVTAWPAGNFTEPYGPHIQTTYWKSSDTTSDTGDGYSSTGRAYIMYMAEQVKPPSYATAGVDNFNTYPTTGASITDLRDAVNWEASNHSSSWSTYFYAYVSTSGLTSTTLHSDIQTDVYSNGAPLVVYVNTYVNSSLHLPNWSSSVIHAITIVGYNDSTGMYRYLDTCGAKCGSSSNGGTHDVSQSTLFSLLTNAGYGFIW